MNLTVKNASFSYDKKEEPILKNISFELFGGEKMAIMGQNGAGKTTLLRCLCGFLKWDSGSAMIGDMDLRKEKSENLFKVISYVPQNKVSPPDLSVYDMIVMGRSGNISIFSLPGAKDKEAAENVIERFSLGHIANKSCSELSGGQYQMVLIARAIVNYPKVLILDEPESNLDYQNQLLVLETIDSLSKEGISCIFNTHFPGNAVRWADKALMIAMDGSYIFDDIKKVITEDNIRRFYGIDACIGSIKGEYGEYMDIIPIKRNQ
ncbi:MAG: ABC transporter ATP-binding protein [Lachnospiraceae bacterium]|nr:ABC transporter ATP-binding protein [Lachnospiraceae bacterium]